MKKIISFALFTCMLLSVILPLSVYAAPAVDGSDGNTSRFYNKQSNTGLDAYPGSANVDGVWDENDEWDNALPLTLNESTKSLITDCGISSVYDGDFYLLWDEKGLYVMEVQRKWSGSVKYEIAQAGESRPWNAWMTQIFVSPNQKFVQNTSKVRGLFVVETYTDESGNNVALNTPVKAVVTQRDLKYTSWPGAVSGSYVTPESIEGVTSYFSKTANGKYVMETFISWGYLGMQAPDANSNADIVDAIGVKLGMGRTGGTHLGNLASGSEGTGLDPVTLKAEPTTLKKAAAPEAIDTTKAEAYWTDAENGQFTVNGDATEYEISTAEQLLGLSLALENSANDKDWTQGKTFKLTNDIDLNPGMDWSVYNASQLNPDAAITSVCEYYYADYQTPTNVWKSLDNFYGIFDGQGHTVSGVWGLNAPNGTGSSGTTEWGVFAGRAYPGTEIKNVVLDNGYISSPSGGGIGGIVGAFRHEVNETNKGQKVLLENIYVGNNFTVNASAVASGKQVGGIIATGWNGTSTTGADYALNVEMKNIVFGGHFEGSEACQYDGVFMGINRTNNSGYVYKTSMENCVLTGTYSSNTSQDVFNASTKVNNFVEPTEITDDMKGAWIETEKGILPVVTADMLTKYYWQATTEKDGVYSVRLIGEIASIDYQSVDFRVEINRASDGKTAVWGYGINGYVTAKSAYSSILANNQEVTAADLNAGVLDGEANNMYVMTLNDLDASENYTLSITTFWTLEDGTVIEGQSVKNITPTAWVVNA